MASSEESDLIFTLRSVNNVGIEETDVVEDNYDEEVKILSILWKNGKVGAAYFDCNEKTLFVYEEVNDTPPQFYITSSIYREVAPKYLITIGKLGDDFTQHLIYIVSLNDGAATTDTVRSLAPNMFLLSAKEYIFETCRSLLCELNMTIAAEMPEAEKELYVNSHFNFDFKISVHAAGALVKYLDKNWVHFISNKDDLQYLEISQISLRGHVFMDPTTLHALQVFQQCSHDASFKRGLQSSNREGLSIFRLFSSNCKSKSGQISLKNMLLKPLNDINELTKRLDFISFVLHPNHQEFVESLQDNIKNVSDVTLILAKIKNSRATCRDWSSLYKSIYHSVFIRELTRPYQKACQLLTDFCNSVTMELTGLETSINNALDFTSNKIVGRPEIKLGLDESLDAKKLRRQDIEQHVTAAAELAAHQLPDYLHECAIVYLPEMGHLIAIKEWEPDCDPDDLNELGFQFMFTLRETIHYKNPLCLELDERLGDINAEIIAHENRILKRLSSFIVKYNKGIREPLRMLALIDALIALAKVSAQNNYVRPSLNNENMHEIQDCRHPLLELVASFQPNDFFSGKNYSHIKIITGPNGSGKSVYLKEIALTIYLAHVGSYVPAKTANVGMMHSIHSRMQATESASVRLSAFMIDAIQATQAEHNAGPNSLILLDEFGRGTAMDDGFALVAGVLRSFYKKGNDCPHILVSTHYQNISNYLPQGPLVDYLKMTHSEENGALLFLYKLAGGISNSFAFNIGSEVGLDESIIRRAKEIFTTGKTLRCVVTNENYPSSRNDDALLEFLRDVDIPELDQKN